MFPSSKNEPVDLLCRLVDWFWCKDNIVHLVKDARTLSVIPFWPRFFITLVLVNVL